MDVTEGERERVGEREDWVKREMVVGLAMEGLIRLHIVRLGLSED